MSFDPKPIIDLAKKLESDIASAVVVDAEQALIPALEAMANSLLPAGSPFLNILDMVEKSQNPALDMALKGLLDKLLPKAAV